ncbi:hypothetical protein EJB05_38253, partial [Eragrostis curvula]
MPNPNLQNPAAGYRLRSSPMAPRRVIGSGQGDLSIQQRANDDVAASRRATSYNWRDRRRSQRRSDLLLRQHQTRAYAAISQVVPSSEYSSAFFAEVSKMVKKALFGRHEWQQKRLRTL